MSSTESLGGRPTPGLPLLLIGLLFLVSRLAALLPSPATDVGIYARYAWEQEAAARRGESFPEHHAREVERQAEKARAAGTLIAPIDEYKEVEYPPLAVAVMRLPALGMGDETGDEAPSRSFELRYYWTFRAGMVVVDVALFVLVLRLARRFFPGEDRRERGQRLLMYVVCTLALWHLLYDRLDLLLTAPIVLALALLTGRRHYGWSFAVLAGAILFKVVPLVLAPLWVVGAMPADRPLELWRPRVLAGLAGRSVFLLVLVVGGLLPFYLGEGAHCLDFLTYHRARPLEIGSLAASVPLLLLPLGHPITVTYSYGSINLHSPLTPTLAALSPWLTAGALLAATVLLLIHFHRLSPPHPTLSPPGGEGRVRGTADALPRGATLAQLYPLFVVRYTLLLLMLFIATGKVFSTQYLLWLVPLAVLLPSGGQRLFTWLFLLVCALSTILVPFLFLSDLTDPAAPPTLPLTVKEPTARLVILLVVRNVLFLGLLIGLAAHLVSTIRARSVSDGPG